MQNGDVEITPSLRIPLAEFEFQTSRSGGPGGQNVNKVETRVELRFDLAHSAYIHEDVRIRLMETLAMFLTNDGTLCIASQRSRSQWQNKQNVIEKFADLLRRALKPPKKRMKTKPTRSSKQKRLDQKHRKSETKRQRRRPADE